MRSRAAAILGALVCRGCGEEFPSAGTLRAHQRDLCGDPGREERLPRRAPARSSGPLFRGIMSDAVPCGSVRLLVPGSFAKCLGPGGCGATLRTRLDAQLHRCHPRLTMRNALAQPEAFYGVLSRWAIL